MSSSKRQRRLAITAGIVAAYAVGTAVAVRQGASIKSLRLGLYRVQWCPVGRHIDLVRLVKNADLSPTEREYAADHHDLPVP